MIDGDLLERLAPYTKQSRARLEAMAAALGELDRQGIAGDVVECGVWRGASIILARLASPQRRCWLFDTFDGMTAPEPLIDISKNFIRADVSYQNKTTNGRKWAACSLADVIVNLQGFGAYDPNKLRTVVGDVRETLRSPDIPDSVALLRLDTDWYASTRTELETLWPRLVPGGVLIVDDYGHWLGARAAVNEFFRLEPHGIAHWGAFTQIDETAVMLVKELQPMDLGQIQNRIG